MAYERISFRLVGCKSVFEWQETNAPEFYAARGVDERIVRYSGKVIKTLLGSLTFPVSTRLLSSRCDNPIKRSAAEVEPHLGDGIIPELCLKPEASPARHPGNSI